MKDNTPSRTALLIAFGLIVLGGDEYGRRKCPPGAISAQIRLLTEAGLPSRRCLCAIHNLLFSKLVRLFLWCFIHADMLEGIGIRKCFMEEHVRTCLAQNCTQVLIVAAGYDTLALRLSQEYTEVQFWELDHPATAKVKQRALRGMGQPKNMHTIATDLTQTSLEEIMTQQEQYNVNSRTVVVMEGLTFYLSEKEVRGLFASVSSVVGPKSSVCFDFFGRNSQRGVFDLGRLTPLLHYFVKLAGEPWKWGIDPNELQEFFQDSSWTVKGATQSVGIERLACVELTT
jgi:methyltransferase (TIGR00027 family)